MDGTNCKRMEYAILDKHRKERNGDVMGEFSKDKVTK